MRAYSFAPASEPKLSNRTEVQDATEGLNVVNGPNIKSIPYRDLKHLPLSVVPRLVVLLNAIFLIRYFPPASKHPGVFSILKPGKDPALSSSYRRIRLLGMIGKLFERIQPVRILCEVSGRGLLRNEHFGFRH